MPTPAVETTPEHDTALAPRWKVLLHDDPVTAFEFVRSMLERVFDQPASQALRITREAHETGVALVEVLPLEQAEFRRDRAHSLARAQGYPLTLTLEPAD